VDLKGNTVRPRSLELGSRHAWVRFYDGDEAIVGGSRIER
jgi:hypothetical protein